MQSDTPLKSRANQKFGKKRKYGSYACQKCGNPFTARSDGNPKFCSRKCNAVNRGAKHLLEWHKINDSDFGHTKHPRICNGCGEQFVPKRYRDGKYCSRGCVPLAAILLSENVQTLRLNALRTYQHTKRFSEKRYNAKRWHLRSPANIEYHPINLNRFVKLNPELFDVDDVKPIYKDGRCRAMVSLKNLRPSDKRKKQQNTWKGWTWISIIEKRFNDGDDLLGRHGQFPTQSQCKTPTNHAA